MKECQKWSVKENEGIKVLEHNTEDRVIVKPVDLIRYCAKNCKYYDSVEVCGEKLVDALLHNKKQS